MEESALNAGVIVDDLAPVRAELDLASGESITTACVRREDFGPRPATTPCDPIGRAWYAVR